MKIHLIKRELHISYDPNLKDKFLVGGYISAVPGTFTPDHVNYVLFSLNSATVAVGTPDKPYQKNVSIADPGGIPIVADCENLMAVRVRELLIPPDKDGEVSYVFAGTMHSSAKIDYHVEDILFGEIGNFHRIAGLNNVGEIGYGVSFNQLLGEFFTGFSGDPIHVVSMLHKDFWSDYVEYRHGFFSGRDDDDFKKLSLNMKVDDFNFDRDMNYCSVMREIWDTAPHLISETQQFRTLKDHENLCRLMKDAINRHLDIDVDREVAPGPVSLGR